VEFQRRIDRARKRFFENYKKGLFMNKVYLFGVVGSDIETKNVNGNYIAETSLATHKKWKDKNGEQKEKTAWHNIVAWNKVAELLKEKLEKGCKVLIEGEIENGSFIKSDGSKGYYSKVNVSSFTAVPKQTNTDF
jgi:single-strand DNA-binding protein